MTKTRSQGLSGMAVAMVGAGALVIYSAIKGTSPLTELRAILTGQRPEPLSTSAKGAPLTSGQMETGTYQGQHPGAGKIVGAVGLRPHVRAEADFIASTWGIKVEGFALRNIAGTNTLSDHARGLALDAMVPKGVAGQNIGDAIFNHYIQNAKTKRVHYVIWQHTIWSVERGSHSYAKSDHFNHVHISFYPIGSSRAQ
jgi:hypothetical protein